VSDFFFKANYYLDSQKYFANSSGNFGLGLFSVMQLIIYAGFLLTENPGKGTVGYLWLFFLETRGQDTTETKVLCFKHKDLYALALEEA